MCSKAHRKSPAAAPIPHPEAGVLAVCCTVRARTWDTPPSCLGSPGCTPPRGCPWGRGYSGLGEGQAGRSRQGSTGREAPTCPPPLPPALPAAAEQPPAGVLGGSAGCAPWVWLSGLQRRVEGMRRGYPCQPQCPRLLPGTQSLQALEPSLLGVALTICHQNK